MKKALLFLAAALLVGGAAFANYGSQAAPPARAWELPSALQTEAAAATAADAEAQPSVLLAYDEQGILDFIAVQDEHSPLVHVFEALACEASAENIFEAENGGGSPQNRVTFRQRHKLYDGATTASWAKTSSELFRHTREYDAETGLYYFRHRYYDPELGRFTQTDPMGYADSMNLYQAFNQSPMNFGDPMGLETPGITLQGVQNLKKDKPKMVPPPLLWELTLRGVCVLGKCRGYNQAAKNLWMYLDQNNAGYSNMDAAWLTKHKEVKEAIETGEKKLKGQLASLAVSLDQGGAINRWHSEEIPTEIRPKGYSDLYFASGSSQVRMRLASMHIERVDKRVRAQGLMLINWEDPYDWHDGLMIEPFKAIPGPNVTPLKNIAINDKDLRILAELGMAKQYDLGSAWLQTVSYDMSLAEWQAMIPAPPMPASAIGIPPGESITVSAVEQQKTRNLVRYP